jgi:hypothetical protein
MHSAMSQDDALSSNYAMSESSNLSRSSISSRPMSSSSHYARSETSNRSSISSHSMSSSDSLIPFQRNDSQLSSGTVKEAQPDELVAHPIIDETSEEEQEVAPPPFWSDDLNPPSFLPADPSTLQPNVTPHFENPIAVGEFEGAVVFSGRPIAPMLVPNQSGFREATGSGIPQPGTSPYFVDRAAQLSSSSSSQSIHSTSSSNSNVLPLPPRAPASLRPSNLEQPQPPQQQQQQQPLRLGQIARRFRGPKKS